MVCVKDQGAAPAFRPAGTTPGGCGATIDSWYRERGFTGRQERPPEAAELPPQLLLQQFHHFGPGILGGPCCPCGRAAQSFPDTDRGQIKLAHRSGIVRKGDRHVPALFVGEKPIRPRIVACLKTIDGYLGKGIRWPDTIAGITVEQEGGLRPLRRDSGLRDARALHLQAIKERGGIQVRGTVFSGLRAQANGGPRRASTRTLALAGPLIRGARRP